MAMATPVLDETLSETLESPAGPVEPTISGCLTEEEAAAVFKSGEEMVELRLSDLEDRAQSCDIRLRLDAYKNKGMVLGTRTFETYVIAMKEVMKRMPDKLNKRISEVARLIRHMQLKLGEMTHKLEKLEGQCNELVRVDDEEVVLSDGFGSTEEEINYCIVQLDGERAKNEYLNVLIEERNKNLAGLIDERKVMREAFHQDMALLKLEEKALRSRLPSSMPANYETHARVPRRAHY